MLLSHGGELADPCTDKASPPSPGLQRCQATVSAEHGYLEFWADKQEALSIELLRQQGPGPDGSHVVRVSALEATDIQMHLELHLCILKSLCCELKHLAPFVATLHSKQQCSSLVKCCSRLLQLLKSRH